MAYIYFYFFIYCTHIPVLYTFINDINNVRIFFLFLFLIHFIYFPQAVLRTDNIEQDLDKITDNAEEMSDFKLYNKNRVQQFNIKILS